MTPPISATILAFISLVALLSRAAIDASAADSTLGSTIRIIKNPASFPNVASVKDRLRAIKASIGKADNGQPEVDYHHNEWSYNDQLTWSREYPICDGKNMRQSPIDIQTDSVILKPQSRLEFIDYDQDIGFQLKNTHHSVSVMPIAPVTPSVRVSWLPDGQDFDLQEIHFHWGDGINKGSEHEIDDQKAAAEMHMVHYKRGLKKEDIGHRDNSVLVIGVLIESDSMEHNKLEPLIAKTSHVNGTDSEYVCHNSANLINLLPDHHQSFYYYNGSLTTPPCYETVTWVIMSEPIYMSNDKLIELSNLEANTYKGILKISSNNRDIQPLLNRPVYVSFNTSESVTPKNRKRFSNLGVLGQEYRSYRETIDALKAIIEASWIKIRDARKHFLDRVKSLMGRGDPEIKPP